MNSLILESSSGFNRRVVYANYILIYPRFGSISEVSSDILKLSEIQLDGLSIDLNVGTNYGIMENNHEPRN